MKERVYGEKVSIDTENTVSFYDQRAKTIKNRKQEYTTVLLGDQDPDFSVKWDAYEKQFILPKLKLNQDKVILDIGDIGQNVLMTNPNQQMFYSPYGDHSIQ